MINKNIPKLMNDNDMPKWCKGFTELRIGNIQGRGQHYWKSGLIIINHERIILKSVKKKKIRSIEEMCYFINDIFLTEFICIEMQYNHITWNQMEDSITKECTESALKNKPRKFECKPKITATELLRG